MCFGGVKEADPTVEGSPTGLRSEVTNSKMQVLDKQTTLMTCRDLGKQLGKQPVLIIVRMKGDAKTKTIVQVSGILS